jgi:hypothetical protein
MDTDTDNKDASQLSFHSTQSLHGEPAKAVKQHRIRLGSGKKTPKLPRGKLISLPFRDRQQQSAHHPKTAPAKRQRNQQLPASVTGSKAPSASRSNSKGLTMFGKRFNSKSTAKKTPVETSTKSKQTTFLDSSDDSDDSSNVRTAAAQKKSTSATKKSTKSTKKISKVLQLGESSSEESELELPYEQDLGQPNCVDLSEKSNEPIRPGDVIQYCSPMFVAGRPEGRRVAQIWNTDPDRDFRLVLSNNELLPSDHQVKRIQEYYKGELFPHPGMYRPIENFRMKKAAMNKQVASSMAAFDKQVQQIQNILVEGTRLANEKVAAQKKKGEGDNAGGNKALLDDSSSSDDCSISSSEASIRGKTSHSGNASLMSSSSSSDSSHYSSGSHQSNENDLPRTQSGFGHNKNQSPNAVLKRLISTAKTCKVSARGTGAMDDDSFMSSDSDDDVVKKTTRLSKCTTVTKEEETALQTNMMLSKHKRLSESNTQSCTTSEKLSPQAGNFSLTGKKYTIKPTSQSKWTSIDHKSLGAKGKPAFQPGVFESVLGEDATKVGPLVQHLGERSSLISSSNRWSSGDGNKYADVMNQGAMPKQYVGNSGIKAKISTSDITKSRAAAEQVVFNGSNGEGKKQAPVASVENSSIGPSATHGVASSQHVKRGRPINMDLPSSDEDDDEYDDTLAPSGLSIGIARKEPTSNSAKPPLPPRRHLKSSSSDASIPLRGTGIKEGILGMDEHFMASQSSSVVSKQETHSKKRSKDTTERSKAPGPEIQLPVYDVLLSSSSDDSVGGKYTSRRSYTSRKRKKVPDKKTKPRKSSAFRPSGLDTASPCPSSSDEDECCYANTMTNNRRDPSRQRPKASSGSVSSVQNSSQGTDDSKKRKRKGNRNENDYIWGRAGVANDSLHRLKAAPSAGRLTFVSNSRFGFN